ncbi:MAG: MFS transporter, partial [Chloroflexota bacterium]
MDGEPAAPGAAPLGARALLRMRDFRVLWSAQLISDFGDGLTATALLLLVNHLTGSVAALAVMAIALAVPPLTIGLVAGTYADRWDRRRIMMASDLVRAVLVLGFVLVDSIDRLWLLYLLAFLQSSVGTFFSPAKGAMLPRLVPSEGLMAANSVSQATRVISNVAGTAIAGGMIGLAGIYWPAFVLDALSFVASFLLVSRLPASLGAVIRGEHGTSTGGVLPALAEGLRIVRSSRVLWVTIVVLSMAMLGLGAINVLFVPLIVNVLGASAAWFGPLEAAQTVSMVLATGIVAGLAVRFRSTRIVTVASLAAGLAIASLGRATEVWHVMLVLFLIGWVITPLQSAIVTLLQVNSVDAVRGRVMSVMNASMAATSVISMASAGIFAERFGVQGAFLIGGSVCFAAGLVGLVLYPRATMRSTPEL